MRVSKRLNLKNVILLTMATFLPKKVLISLDLEASGACSVSSLFNPVELSVLTQSSSSIYLHTFNTHDHTRIGLTTRTLQQVEMFSFEDASGNISYHRDFAKLVLDSIFWLGNFNFRY